jgi:hypothetical protein
MLKEKKPLIGSFLMGILYRGYSVPNVKGRRVVMGMSMYKEPSKGKPTGRGRRGKGELLNLIESLVDIEWETAKKIQLKSDLRYESVRVTLETLARLGRIEQKQATKGKNYRRKP